MHGYKISLGRPIYSEIYLHFHKLNQTMKIMILILVVWTIIQGCHVHSMVEYDVTKGNNLEDTEIVNTVEIPSDKSKFVSFDKDSRYMGLLFAGKSEFNWVVDLRIHNTEPEAWSTGNIIAPKHIMTTCRAISLLRSLSGEVVITYFQMYLWEHVMYENYDLKEEEIYGADAAVKREWKLGGVRKVAEYNKHPLWNHGNNRKTLSFDIAIIRLTTPIDLALPFIGYAPIIRDKVDPYSLPDIKIHNLEKRSKICLVGSIGRKYINWKYHMVEDYKVRYRVYKEEWKVCRGMMDKICNKSVHLCAQMGRNARSGRDWVCMRTRAKVGTVCDHDRGAPVVCGDEVVGIVVFGALWDYCNNLIPMPFVVAKLDQFQNFILRDAVDVRSDDYS